VLVSHVISKHVIQPARLDVDGASNQVSNINFAACFGTLDDIRSYDGCITITIGDNCGRMMLSKIKCKGASLWLFERAGHHEVLGNLSCFGVELDGTDADGAAKSPHGFSVTNSTSSGRNSFSGVRCWGTTGPAYTSTDGQSDNMLSDADLDVSMVEPSFADQPYAIFLHGRDLDHVDGRSRGPFNTHFSGVNCHGGGVAANALLTSDAGGVYGDIHVDGFTGALVKLTDDNVADDVAEIYATDNVDLDVHVGPNCPASGHLELFRTGGSGSFGTNIRVGGNGFVPGDAPGYPAEAVDAASGLIRGAGASDPEGILDGAPGSTWQRTGYGLLVKQSPLGTRYGWQDPIIAAYNTSAYSVATAAFLARVPAAQTLAQKALYEALIAGFDADGDLASIKGLWIIGAAEEPTGWRNIISATGQLSKVGSGSTFTANRGFTSDGATYLTSATGLLAALGLTTENNIELIEFAGTNVSSSSMYDVSIGGSAAHIQLNPKMATSFMQTEMNDLTLSDSVSASSDSVGAFSLIRDGSANYRVGVDGTVVQTVTSASTGLPALGMQIGLTGATYSTRMIFAVMLSDASRGDAGTLRKVNRVKTFQTAVGAPT
jgi:hypothetical protein